MNRTYTAIPLTPSYSARDAALILGRSKRLILYLSLRENIGEFRGNRLAFSETDLERLRSHIGRKEKPCTGPSAP